ncbi:MAG: helix-turn-helix domain-containing protein [Micrococcales bacterium]|nr:helix-turn-helix domain-containing protein [Micrococcales bacterium]
MSATVFTLEPDAIASAQDFSPWEQAISALVRRAAEDGQRVVVSTETKMLTPDEAARMLMVSRSTISRRIAAGEIKATKVGNRHRIPYSEARRAWERQMDIVATVSAPDIEAELFGDDT